MSPNLRIKLDKKKISFGQKLSRFSAGEKKKTRREKGREKKNQKSKLLFSIHGVPLVGIRWAKNENSSTRRGLCVGTENIGFRRGFKLGIRETKSFWFKKCPRDFLVFLLRSKR